MILPKNEQNDEEAMNGFFNQLFSSIKPENGNLNQMTLTLHMQLILKAFTTAIMGSAISYFASLQTVFLVLRITGDITWPWITIFCPMLVMAIFFFVRKKYYTAKTKKELDQIDNILAAEGNTPEGRDIQNLLDNVLTAVGKSKDPLR